MAEASENPNISRRTGKPVMTPSERARHARMVQLGKEEAFAKPDPAAVRERAKQIVAERKQAKPKPKGGKAKPKETRTKQEIANQNRAQIAKQTGMGELEGTLVRLNAGMQGAGMENDKHDELIKRGLAERHADGKVTLSASGKKWKAAADRGDVSGAQGALSEAQSKQADKQAKEKATGEKRAAAESKKQASAAEREAKKAERAKKVAEKQKETAQKRKVVEKAKRKETSAPAEKPAPRPASPKPRGGGGGGAATGAPSTGGGGGGGGDKGGSPAKQEQQQRKEKVQDFHLDRIAQGAKPSASVQAELEEAGLIGPDGKITEAGKKRLVNRKRPAAKGIDMEIKAGARHSRTDQQHIQAIHDSAVACGAGCGDDTEDDSEELEGAIKSIMDDPGHYAMHECGDIMQAASALQTLCLLIQSELAEEDEDTTHVSQLTDAARTLVDFIDSELDELEGAAKEDASETRGNGPMKAYDPEEQRQQQELTALAASGRAIQDDAWLHIDGGAIKAYEDDTIKGLAILYGTKATPDLERDYYDQHTDLWLDHWGWPRPITYHHGIDRDTRDDPVIGHWTKAIQTDEGVWLEGQLDRAHRYYKAIKQLAERGYLKISSDSGPQWVIREPQSNGANYLKRWPLVTASVTVTPMEPRMLPVEVKALLAETGFEGIDEESQEAQEPNTARADELKAVDEERARAILLELDLIELETR